MISEPATLATDYALAAANVWAGALLLKRLEGQRARMLWSAAFFALALTALLGGTWHGFHELLADASAAFLWRATLGAAGLASVCILAATAFFFGRYLEAFLFVAIVKFLIYETWIAGHDQFVWVLADSGGTMLAAALLHFARWREPGSGWILAAVAVSAAAAAAQASGFDLHRHFNHNDLYHVIQITATVLFFRGAATIRDRRNPRP